MTWQEEVFDKFLLHWITISYSSPFLVAKMIEQCMNEEEIYVTTDESHSLNACDLRE
jgi:hypothetical protein